MQAEEIRELSAAEISESLQLLFALTRDGRIEMPPEPLNFEEHLRQVKLVEDFCELMKFKLEKHRAKIFTMGKPRQQTRYADTAEAHIAQAEQIDRDEQEAAAKVAQRDAAQAAALKAAQQREEAAREQTLRMLQGQFR